MRAGPSLRWLHSFVKRHLTTEPIVKPLGQRLLTLGMDMAAGWMERWMLKTSLVRFGRS